MPHNVRGSIFLLSNLTSAAAVICSSPKLIVGVAFSNTSFRRLLVLRRFASTDLC